MSARITQLEALLQQTPHDCFLHHALALEYLKLDNTEMALMHFTANLNFDKNYVGTYYHLAKLHERLANTEQAIAIYEQGMEVAKAAGDQHSYSELRSAYEEFVF